jgi:hypothetical protein
MDNYSSMFFGDGDIDLSEFNWGGTEDAPAPPLNIAELLGNVTTGNEVNKSFLSNLSSDELARYQATQEEGYKSSLAGIAPQELGISQAMIDEFNKNYQPQGGFGSQWQNVGTNKIMINDDGTGTVLDPTTKQSSFLTEKQVQALIENGMLNSRKSNYNKSTSGSGLRLGGSKSSQNSARSNAALMAAMAAMSMMDSKGGGSPSTAKIPEFVANRSQTDYSGTSPGSANVDYFTPTTYTPKAAGGGLMSLAGGGMSNLGSYSDGGRLLRGPGDGVSDSIPATIGGKQPARLATGEFVVPARIVSELGNGSTEAGAKKLYAMMDRVQKARRKTKNVAADTKAHKYLPA